MRKIRERFRQAFWLLALLIFIKAFSARANETSVFHILAIHPYGR